MPRCRSDYHHVSSCTVGHCLLEMLRYHIEVDADVEPLARLPLPRLQALNLLEGLQSFLG